MEDYTGTYRCGWRKELLYSRRAQAYASASGAYDLEAGGVEGVQMKVDQANRIDKILKVLDNADSRMITVFGDFCLDKYMYIDPKRDEISVETGLTAYQVEAIKCFPGVGGTVTNNLRSLGVQVRGVGLAGEDGEGFDLLKALNKTGVNTEYFVCSDSVMTAAYVKRMRKANDNEYVEMKRIDIRNFTEKSKDIEDKLLENLEKALLDSHGIIITDQYLESNFATVTQRIRNELAEIAGRHPDKLFYADSRGFADAYKNITIKCNQFELPGIKKDSHKKESIITCGKALLSKNNKAVVVTMGADGAYVFENDGVEHIPSFVVDGPLDITGAGDATNAGIMLGLTLGLSLPEAVLLGNCISSITIQQIGVTGTATLDQVKQRLMV